MTTEATTPPPPTDAELALMIEKLDSPGRDTYLAAFAAADMRRLVNEIKRIRADLYEAHNANERILARKISEAARAQQAFDDLLASGEASDGYHTHNELYDFRMLYNAHAARGWLAQGYHVVKSWKHADGEKCFGGGWFIVFADLPTGQVSNHYEAKHWDLFDIPQMTPPEWDGHTAAEAADRLRAALGGDRG